MKQIWKPVVGYETEYKISDNGEVYGIKRGKSLTPIPNEWGYLWVGLWKNGKYKARFIHNLVLEAFVGPRPKGMEARHTPDKNPTNNHSSNLKWGTRKENAGDRDKDGSTVKGEMFWSAVATEEQVRKVKELGRSDTKRGRGVRIAALVGLNKRIVRDILNGKTWKHVEG